MVAEIMCEGKRLYLKKNNALFKNEARVIEYLYGKNLNHLNVVAFNDELNCFITSDVGKSVTNVITENYKNVIDSFIKVQSGVEIDKLKDMGLRKFSDDEIVYLCQKYEIANIEKYLKLWQEIKMSIAFSIEHGDFHLGNIFINESGDVSFIDFAEATVTNPLFSLLSFEITLKWRGKLDDAVIEEAKNYWLNQYIISSGHSNKDIKEIYLKSKEMFPLYSIFGMDCLLKTCIIPSFKEKVLKKIGAYKALI